MGSGHLVTTMMLMLVRMAVVEARKREIEKKGKGRGKGQEKGYIEKGEREVRVNSLSPFLQSIPILILDFFKKKAV